MAEGESVKLFVGQVPKHMTESQLLTMFREFALVDEVNIIKDKATRASRGLILHRHYNVLSSNICCLGIAMCDLEDFVTHFFEICDFFEIPNFRPCSVSRVLFRDMSLERGSRQSSKCMS